MVLINTTTFPRVMAVIQEVDGANGRDNRVEGRLPESYTAPAAYENLIREAEQELTRACLTPDELCTLTDGDHDEQLELVRAKLLAATHQLVNFYFNGWPVDGRPVFTPAEIEAMPELEVSDETRAKLEALLDMSDEELLAYGRALDLQDAVYEALSNAKATGYDVYAHALDAAAIDLMDMSADVAALNPTQVAVEELVAEWRQKNPKE